MDYWNNDLCEPEAFEPEKFGLNPKSFLVSSGPIMPKLPALFELILFLEILFKSMKKGDIFLLTTLNGMGVDIQVLWEYSKSVSPPHHLNFFNPKSIEKILKQVNMTN